MNELKKGCTLQHGKYKIVKTLGRGSFGITYLATTKVALSGGLGKMDVIVNVAIKEFFMEEFNSRSRDGSSVDGTSASLVKNYRKKFHREAENLGKLKHPNIVKVLEVFDENNTTYYAMEYVEGESLDEYIKSRGRLPENEVLSFLPEIGAALKHMHDHKMLHLDLKPKNIMRNKDGHLLLIDFGLSKQYDQNGEPESSTTLGLGTPGYAPIEQANYKQDGTFPATLDIYALGATIYKMLTGSTPPYASDLLSEGFPDELFEKLSTSSSTVAMVRKAMGPVKKQRYQTVSELLGEIDGKSKVEDKTENETEYVVGVEIDSPLPMPDYVVKLSLKNPAPGSLSFDFYLNDGNRNNVIVYRGKKEILDEFWWTGLSDEVIEALKRNGFFSKEHWERESGTSPLEGITVSCTFFYKNGEKFVREVKHADPAYNHLLLDAVKDVVSVGELWHYIDMALDKEHDYSTTDMEDYGISIFSFAPNNQLPIYYRGKTYMGDSLNFLRLKSYSEIEQVFTDVKYRLCTTDDNRTNFETYLRGNANKISSAYNIITYCSESDLLHLLKKLRQNPWAFGQHCVVQEMQLIPLIFDGSRDETSVYEYQNLYCESESGGGIIEILQTGFINNRDGFMSDPIEKPLSKFEGFAYIVLGATVLYHIKNKNWIEDTVLLTTMPFDIKAEIWINGRFRDGINIIKRNTTVPCKISEVICDDNCTLVILFLGKRFSIDIREEFGYSPRTFEVTVDVDANTNIKYILKDKEMNKEIFFSQPEIFKYEVITDNEDTTW